MPSLYVHVPWCRSKCRYCAFYSVRAQDLPSAAFAKSVAAEVRTRAPSPFRPTAVYVGGGTPSLLGPDGIETLCHALRDAADLSAVVEWSFEANPDSATPAVLEAMLAGGATRLSLGAQSLDDDTLRWLGRPHDAAAVRRAVAAARQAGFASVGLDLIAGIPGVSGAVWRRTLGETLSLDPDHLSVYALTVEPNTPLAADVGDGRVRMPPDDEVMDALAETEAVLSAAGLVRYEISNYARPGRECLYNLSVWRGEDYLGVGPGASSRIGLTRRTNASDVEAWVAAGLRPGCFDSVFPAALAESLSPAQDRAERFLTGLRLAEGADLAHLTPAEAECMAPTFHRLRALGLVEECAPNGRWRLTARGREVADAVAGEVLGRLP